MAVLSTGPAPCQVTPPPGTYTPPPPHLLELPTMGELLRTLSLRIAGHRTLRSNRDSFGSACPVDSGVDPDVGDMTEGKYSFGKSPGGARPRSRQTGSVSLQFALPPLSTAIGMLGS